MLVTTIPATLDQGGELLYLARANRLLLDGDKVTASNAWQWMSARGAQRPPDQGPARHYGSPAGGHQHPGDSSPLEGA